jgi:phage terminase small subunit
VARKPAAPSGLSNRAKRVWSKTLDNYELREDELSLLTDYCMELSIVDHLQEELLHAPLMVRASHGGEAINPIYSEIRMHRSTAMSLWKALKLPELDAGEAEESDDERVVPMSREESARKAANARWKRG